jgi:amino acid transporter
MGAGPAVFFTVTAFFVMNFVCIPSVHAGSRTLWAFSRDDMVPFSRYWHRVHKRTDTPLHAVWLYTLLCIAINLVGLGSPILIAAVFNVCAIALNWSYCIPILCKMAFGKFERGPWHLGRFSTAINAWAVAWNAFLSVLFVLPIIRPVTPENVSAFPPKVIPLYTYLQYLMSVDELCVGRPGICHCLLNNALVAARAKTLHWPPNSSTPCQRRSGSS